MFIEGCTNIYASNYNPHAQINDGSCLFVSGCTIPFADNYNSNAVIDDGSCTCNSYNLLLDFSGSTEGYEIVIPNSGDTCVTTISFDFILKSTCEDILDIYLENNGETELTKILNDLSLDFKLFEKVDDSYNEIFSENIWMFDFNKPPYNLALDNDPSFCEAFFDVLRAENGIDCNENIEQNFNLKRNDVELVLTDIENKPLLFTLQFKNFNVPHCVILDNIKLTTFCSSEVNECILIPKQFGFDLAEEIDNTKTEIYSDKLTLNSKNISLRINPYNYVDEDIVAYFNAYGYLPKEEKLVKISLDRINTEYIDVRRRQKTSTYIYHDYIYSNYLNGLKSCGSKSKELDYDYTEEINKLINPSWQAYVNQLIPATTRWNNGTYFYKNFSIHQNKHKYKNYTLDKGCDGDATINFEIITDNLCIKNKSYKSRFEQISILNDICDQCGSTGVTYSYFDDGNNESGRLIQYSGDNITSVIETVNFDTVSEIDCSSLNDCQLAVFINSVISDEATISLEFTTVGVTSIEEISIYINDVKQPNDFITFNVESGEGIFVKEMHFGEHEILINVSNDCNNVNDIIIYELCGGFFTNLPLTLTFDGNANANGTIIGQFYGVENIMDLNVTIGGKPALITSFDGVNFTIDFTLPWGTGASDVILNATTNCGNAIIEGTINT